MSNEAAWCDGPGTAIRIDTAPTWPVERNEVKIQHRAVAINPADSYFINIPQVSAMVKEWPFIFGIDLSGVVIESKSDMWKIGDRVMATSPGPTGSAGPKVGCFQSQSVQTQDTIARLPDSWTFTDAAGLPLAAATAASALFVNSNLGLQLPQLPAAPKNGKLLLIWGASGSVGSMAVTMAAHAGYEVLATCSPHNAELVKSLGAAKTFDYKQASVVDDVVQAIKGREGDYIGAFVAMQSRDEPLHAAAVAKKLGLFNSPVASSNLDLVKEDIPGVRCFAIFAFQIFPSWTPASKSANMSKAAHLSETIFRTWLPQAMESGAVRPVPLPEVLGRGLAAVQDGLDRMKQGVSARKLIIEL